MLHVLSNIHAENRPWPCAHCELYNWAVFCKKKRKKKNQWSVFVLSFECMKNRTFASKQLPSEYGHEVHFSVGLGWQLVEQKVCSPLYKSAMYIKLIIAWYASLSLMFSWPLPTTLAVVYIKKITNGWRRAGCKIYNLLYQRKNCIKKNETIFFVYHRSEMKCGNMQPWSAFLKTEKYGCNTKVFNETSRREWRRK